MNTITRHALTLALESEQAPVLLEALPEEYFRTGHLPGARLLPHDRFLLKNAAVAGPSLRHLWALPPRQ